MPPKARTVHLKALAARKRKQNSAEVPEDVAVPQISEAVPEISPEVSEDESDTTSEEHDRQSDDESSAGFDDGVYSFDESVDALLAPTFVPNSFNSKRAVDTRKLEAARQKKSAERQKRRVRAKKEKGDVTLVGNGLITSYFDRTPIERQKIADEVKEEDEMNEEDEASENDEVTVEEDEASGAVSEESDCIMFTSEEDEDSNIRGSSVIDLTVSHSNSVLASLGASVIDLAASHSASSSSALPSSPNSVSKSSRYKFVGPLPEPISLAAALLVVCKLAPISQRKNLQSKDDKRSFLRCLAVAEYIRRVQEHQIGGPTKVSISQDVAVTIYRTNIPNRGRQIRSWTAHLLAHGKMPPPSRRGCHQKVFMIRSMQNTYL